MGMPKFTPRLGRWICFRNSSMAQVGRFQGNIPWPRAGPICFQVAMATRVEIVALVTVP